MKHRESSWAWGKWTDGNRHPTVDLLPTVNELAKTWLSKTLSQSGMGGDHSILFERISRLHLWDMIKSNLSKPPRSLSDGVDS